MAEHCEPFRVAMVYVVVDDGVTDTLIGLLFPLNGIAPGDKVPLHGPDPVTAMLNDVGPTEPAHCVLVPLITPVGRGLIVTVPLPLKSAAMAVQLASDKVAIVYAVVDDGVTVTLIGLVLPLNGMAPGDKVPLHGPLPVTAILRFVVVD